VVVNQQYDDTAFLASTSLVVFTSTAVGGLGSAFGAILGATIVEGSAVYLPPSWQLFPAALGVLIVLILFPRGLAGLCYDLRDWAIDRLRQRQAGASGDAAGRPGPALVP
jgi:ABC-type branched-subunit amino acid transport system permease subunit